MASKVGLAGGIPERRVRPIWDAIDSRQYKSALKHSSTLLSKYPNSPYALALKALVLERMGKVEEALPVCLSAKDLLYKDDSALMDDLTLSTLQMVFQRLDHLDLATSCYEHACGRFPTNVELMMGLFNCYVREYSFVKQQQTAIKMYKLVGEERFLLWAVCSIQLQVFCGNGEEKLLRLAEGLLKKHVSSHSLHEPEALIVYISILEQHEKYGEALEILSGDLGSLLMIDVDKLRIKGRLLARSGDYATGTDVYQRILEQCPDDWECFLHYLGCLLEDDSSWNSGPLCNLIHPPKFFGCKLSQLTNDMFDARMSDALAFVQKLQTDNSNIFLRCPNLALLEIERRKHLHGKDTHEEIIESLVQYFATFGHLASFASDVEIFLEILTPDGKREFLGKLRKSSDSHVGEPTKVLGRMVTYFKVHELIGQTEKHPTTELYDAAVEMMELFCKNLKLSKDLDPQESMHGEEFLSLVCDALVQLYFKTRQLGYFVEAIMVLEYGLTLRRYVWQYKVLLLHLYSHMGAYSLANDRYKSLDVKNILMETVLHNILPQMLVSPLWVDLSYLLKDYLRFMDDHFRESADLTFLAYRHRNYSKVIEFVQFKERLQRSSQYLIAKIESSVLQLKRNADNIDDEEGVLESLNFGIYYVELSDQIGSKALSFNEDMTSRPWWTPTPERNYLLGPFEGVSYCPKENLKKEREENIRRVIERKSLLPRMIYLSIQSAAAPPFKENVKVSGSVSVAKISSELRLLLERYAGMLGSSFGNATSIIMEVYGGSKSFEAFGSDMIDWMNFAVFLNAWSLTSVELPEPNGNRCSNDLWHVVDSLLRSYISEKTTTMQSLTSLRGDLPSLIQFVTEPLAWHGLVIQSCVRSCQPAGKKKKKVGPVEQTPTLPSDKVRESILSLCSIVEQVSKWAEGLVSRPEDENIDIILSSLRTNEGPGRVFHILHSSITSIDDLEVGARIAQALRSWDSADVAREMVTGISKVLSEFLHICQSKRKSFLAWKQLLSQA